MRRILAEDVPHIDFDEIVRAVNEAPVLIVCPDGRNLVMLSAEEYDRLKARDER